MKILFSLRHAGLLRNFASTIRELADRGHDIHLQFMMPDKMSDPTLLLELAHRYQSVTYTEPPRKKPMYFWLTLSRALRFSVDFVRYRGPEFSNAPKMTDRARARVPRPMARVIDWLGRYPAGRRVLTRALLFAERAIPVDPWVSAQVSSQKPDVVLVSPLVDLGSDQVDVMKAAVAQGLPTGLAVHSWDNLTTKGLVRIQPDRLFVWNDGQREEAVTMHGVAADQIVVTGAMVYDQWFDRAPSTSREEFCAKVGLRPDQPYFLYLCSSPFIAPNEVDFIERWVAAVRSAPDSRLRRAGLLIRPHPQNNQPWHRFDTQSLDNVAVFPRAGGNPVDAHRKNEFFDSLFHSAGAVGINTSAQIEAGVIGRPVYTIRSADHAATQEGTLHFNYLLSYAGGLVHDAGSFEEHVQQLSAALDRTADDEARLRRFVQAFVRPKGLQQAATPVMADAVEALGRLGKRRRPRLTLGLAFTRLLLFPLSMSARIARSLDRSARKRERGLRPLSLSGFVLKPVYLILDGLFAWTWTREFAKRYIFPRVLAKLTRDAPTEESLAIPKVIHRLAAKNTPLVVGPWLSEVGFEVLYWIPFLNWARTYRHFDPDRLVVVSRGGVQDWYRGIASQYMDLFDFFSPDEFRLLNEQRVTEGKQKQRVMTDFDRQILKMVQVSLERRDVEVLHPMYMYRLFHRFWKNQASVNTVDAFSLFRPLPAPDASILGSSLPRDYVAVRFYFNESFPDTDANRELATRVVGALSEHTDVVVLNPDMRVDDHWDMDFPGDRHRLHSVKHLMMPRNNLGVQSAVIAGAKAFIGTYGGLSYVAPFYGVPSLALYSDPNGFAMHHLDLAVRVFARMQHGLFTAIDTRALDLVTLASGAGRPPTFAR